MPHPPPPPPIASLEDDPDAAAGVGSAPKNSSNSRTTADDTTVRSSNEDNQRETNIGKPAIDAKTHVKTLSPTSAGSTRVGAGRLSESQASIGGSMIGVEIGAAAIAEMMKESGGEKDGDHRENGDIGEDVVGGGRRSRMASKLREGASNGGRESNEGMMQQQGIVHTVYNNCFDCDGLISSPNHVCHVFPQIPTFNSVMTRVHDVRNHLLIKAERMKGKLLYWD
jgi:hypothetical protein